MQIFEVYIQQVALQTAASSEVPFFSLAMHSERVWLGALISTPPAASILLTYALVTGSSSGFGLAMCKLALAKGDKVVATLRRPVRYSPMG